VRAKGDRPCYVINRVRKKGLEDLTFRLQGKERPDRRGETKPGFRVRSKKSAKNSIRGRGGHKIQPRGGGKRRTGQGNLSL